MATLIFNRFALMPAKSCKQMSVTSKRPNILALRSKQLLLKTKSPLRFPKQAFQIWLL
jgi:hypothetical protein